MTQFLQFQSLKLFAHAKTAVLSWHVQNFVAIPLSHLGWQAKWNWYRIWIMYEKWMVKWSMGPPQQPWAAMVTRKLHDSLMGPDTESQKLASNTLFLNHRRWHPIHYFSSSHWNSISFGLQKYKGINTKLSGIKSYKTCMHFCFDYDEFCLNWIALAGLNGCPVSYCMDYRCRWCKSNEGGPVYRLSWNIIANKSSQTIGR